ncbi:MAG: nucleoside kinase [Agathobacter sp.]|nr:nucleoside kinase [Agathobacter sp.]
MQEYSITLRLPHEEREMRIPGGTTFETLGREVQELYANPVVLAKFNNKLIELGKQIEVDGRVEFITMSDPDGKRVYRRSVTILLQKAVYNLYKNRAKVKVLYSLGHGYYCEIEGVSLTEEDLAKIKTEMKRLVDANLPIQKESIKTDKAVELFRTYGMTDKERLMSYRRSSRVNIYSLDGMVDYYYGSMVPSTGYLQWFDLALYEEGFVLLLPDKVGNQVEPILISDKLYHTLKASKEWGTMMGVGTVGALNDAITMGQGEDIILLQEALIEERIGALAAQIAACKDKKFVMIAGPSSSGKTTFSNRLSIQLRAKGLNPHPIALDDYYLEREKCPRDENGDYDFESLESIDVAQFNDDMTRLLQGEVVDMPSFNFKTGKREYRGRKLQLTQNDILVIEGIHGLNPRLSYSLPEESKFRVYISPLTQLNIDEHNPLPTTDGRILRRIVRDNRTRGTNARETLAMWASVRRGEEKNIFPYQESADVMFNSAHVYEMAVLKVYAEPLLFQIPKDAPEYSEAKRLLKLLDYFLPLPTEGITHNSIIREFVGGSCFHV